LTLFSFYVTILKIVTPTIKSGQDERDLLQSVVTTNKEIVKICVTGSNVNAAYLVV